MQQGQMLLVQQVSCVIKQILPCGENPADWISQIVCRYLQQLKWIEFVLLMCRGRCLGKLPCGSLANLPHFFIAGAHSVVVLFEHSSNRLVSGIYRGHQNALE